MATKATTRKIVKIDEAKCNGCGLCVPSCAEGAIRIIDGKARLTADNLCDGLGNCLGKCPQDAITIEERPAEEFDEQAVRSAPERASSACSAPVRASSGGCPGAMARMLSRPAGKAGTDTPAKQPAGSQSIATAIRPVSQSQLGQWPVQLALVPDTGPMWQDADVLVAADCVPFAYPEFHEKLLAGKSLAIACPKLDDVAPYVEKLARIFAGSSVRSVTVAHMEVPCCGGIVYAVRAALEQSGRNDIEIIDVTIGIDGTIKK